jgi:hypothetical protein
MTKPGRRARNKWLIVAALAGLSVLLFAALYTTAHHTVQSKPAFLPAAELVAKVQFQGGLCKIGGACASTLIIYSDAHYHNENGNGQVDAGQLAQLQQQIAAADFAAIKAMPFTDTCPTAYDGQEATYYFYDHGKQVAVIRSCQTAINLDQPPFKVLGDIMDTL